jgi:hypothetical protein
MTIISLLIIVLVIMCLCYVLYNIEKFTTTSALQTTASLSVSDDKLIKLYDLLQSQKYKVNVLRDALVPV